MGYKVAVTSYQKDGGIDVFLYKGESITGIQVKRKSGKVRVSEIRELVGALVLRNCTEGVFVTTSEFTSCSSDEANVSETMGIPIELYNASRLFDALRLSRWKDNQEVDHPNAPWNCLNPHYVWSDVDEIS
jgi:HJR/Mrr/RecB family endonuclease